MAKGGLKVTAFLLLLMFLGLAIFGIILILSIFAGDVPGAVLGVLMLIGATFTLSALNGILKQLNTPLVRP